MLGGRSNVVGEGLKGVGSGKSWKELKESRMGWTEGGKLDVNRRNSDDLEGIRRNSV